jgi:hypothetical protein
MKIEIDPIILVIIGLLVVVLISATVIPSVVSDNNCFTITAGKYCEANNMTLDNVFVNSRSFKCNSNINPDPRTSKPETTEKFYFLEDEIDKCTKNYQYFKRTDED